MNGFDLCEGCKIPEIAAQKDPFESEDYFSCSDCACHGCEHLHNCMGQCEKSSEV